MNRQAFKQRIQQYKMYKEQNPNISYIDWKNLQKYEDGGEVGDKKEPPYPSFYNGRRVNRWTGEPLATGAVKAAFDIEDAANLTPVGDAITVKDMSQAVLNKDWAGLGIASLGLIPVVGTGLGKVITRGVRGIAKNIERESTDAVRRSVPTVNKDRFTRQLNKVIEKMQQEKGSLRDPNYKISDISDANNARNEVLGDLNKEYFDKARAVDAQYGTDYENTYKKILDAYNDPVEYMQNTPYVKYEDLGIDNQGKINFAPDDERAFEIAVENSPAKLKDYVVTAGKDNATKGTIYHEMSHLVDGMQNPGGTFDIKDNKLLWEAGKEKHFKLFKEYNNAVSNAEKISEYNYRYLTNPFEMKAFVNTARSDMVQLGILNKRTQSATKEQINSYLQHPEAHGSLKKLFKLHKDPDQFYKMFNAMPYLGLTGLGVYNLTNTILRTMDSIYPIYPIPTYKSGGIHIKKKNRGKFTASAKKAGQSVQQHAHSVLNNPNASKLQKKRAQFAVNMKKLARKRKNKNK